MTLSRLLLFPVCLSGLLLAGCPNDAAVNKANYLRSPVTFSIDPVADNHPFCNTVGPGEVFATVEECQSTRKYRLRWERPEDTVGFKEYRIYLDTNPPGFTFAQARKDPTLASFRMEGSPSAADSIIFILTSGGSAFSVPDRLNPRIMRLDTAGRTDSLGRLFFAITTVYNDTRLDGDPRFTWVITTDRFSPYPLQPAFTAKARSVDVAWSRPGDPTSFFDPGADSGIIKGYVLRVVRGGSARTNVPFNPVLSYSMGGVDRTAETKAEFFRTLRQAPGYRFWLPDSHRVFDRLGADLRDSLKASISNVDPQDTVNISLWPVDMLGNFNTEDTGSVTTILLTDTTQPTTPVLDSVPGSVTRNGFTYTFTASRDLVETGSGLAPAASPNANILEYRLSRRRISGPAGGAASVDSVFKIPAALRGQNVFTDTVRYLPPGAAYLVTVQAVDSSGHVSAIGSITINTLPLSFTGADSLATCPPGWVKIPAGRFQLGSNLGGDEAPNSTSPSGTRGIGDYCIEPYEHRAANGSFQTKITWEQARDVCASAYPSNGSHLCTEPEWERACEGTQTPALVYGIQSESKDPQGVRFTCNIGTNDSAMANNVNLRDPTCLSYDGVFDMSGNFAEWVLDPYVSPYPAGDTAIVGQPLAASTSTSQHVFRGTHYLNTSQTPAIMQSAGRCSNRDVPRQLRPKPYAGCTDSLNPKLVVTYASPKPPRCFPLPDSLQGRPIQSVQPGRDTNEVWILLVNQKAKVIITMPIDTAYKLMKPLSALMTPRALALVTFVNAETSEAIVDTMDATEMLSASPAGLEAIFTREASPPWSVRKVGGQYEIRYLYSYSVSQGVPARKYYSNKVIGFRCCSNPVPAPLGKRRAAAKK